MKFKLAKWFVVLLISLIGVSCASNNNVSTLKVNAWVVAGSTTTQNQYNSIQAAVDAAPDSGGWTIAIADGTYNERVEISKPGLRLVGAGTEATRITYLRYAGQPVSANSNETWGTYRSAVVQVLAPDVSLYDLTIENTFDFLRNDGLPDTSPGRISKTQAVALRIAGDADRTLLQRVRLLGYQDTLYADAGRSYMTGGEVLGNIDFIFGKGNMVFEAVDIISRPRARSMKTTGYVTAPSTLLDSEYGLTFLNCRFLRELDVPDGSVPLGRPWHPTTTFNDGRYANPYAVGKTTIINSFMDAHITVNGWDSMGGKAKDGSQIEFDPMTGARFSEWGSYGPGAAVNEQRPQLPDDAIKTYQRQNILNGWQPPLMPPTDPNKKRLSSR